MKKISEYVYEWEEDEFRFVELILNEGICDVCGNDYNQITFKVSKYSGTIFLSIFVGCYTTDSFMTDDMDTAEMVLRDWCAPSASEGMLAQDEVEGFITAARETAYALA